MERVLLGDIGVRVLAECGTGFSYIPFLLIP